jgi:hypothetical protein
LQCMPDIKIRLIFLIVSLKILIILSLLIVTILI